MRMRKPSKILFALVAIVSSAQHTQAQLLNGRSVDSQLVYGDGGGVRWTASASVDPASGAVEIPNFNAGFNGHGWFSIDFVDVTPDRASILITGQVDGGIHCGGSRCVVFTNFSPSLTTFHCVTLRASTISGLTSSRLTTSVGVISLLISGLRAFPGELVRIDLTTVPPPEQVGRLTMNASEVRLCWYAHSNNTYQVQYRSEPAANEWANLGVAMRGAGGISCVAEGGGGTQRLYQVISLP